MYNPQKAKEKLLLPKDSIVEGTIVNIKDGKVCDFVKDTEKWKGDINQPCINLQIEINYESNKINIEHLFTYNEEDGVTVFAPSSNLAKFKKKYNKLPEAGDVVKIATGSEGFGKIKLD